MNNWNKLIKIRDKARQMLKNDPLNESLKDIEKTSNMYLSQINTASGKRVINEVENWFIKIHTFLT